MPPSMPLIVDVSALQDMMQRRNSMLMAHQTNEEHRRGVLEAARARLSLGARGAEPGTYTPTIADMMQRRKSILMANQTREERRRAKLGAAASSAGPGTAEWLWSSAAACPPAKPGESFKSLYNVTDEVLGHGLNGEVKLAVHAATGNKVALKVYHRDQMGRQEVTDLVREVTTQSSLRHPNVAKVEGVYQSDNHIRMVLEHLSGGTLFQRAIQDGVFGEDQAASIIRQLLSAVEHIHAEGLVHRDIKPENVVYASADKDTVKLIDFGFCCHWKEGDRLLTRRCGTESYMAPEVESQFGYTNKADVWSVGIVAHVLLTGHMPGRTADWTPILSRRLAATCSPEAQKFVASLLTLYPDSRLTAREALAHSWLLPHGKRTRRCSYEHDSQSTVPSTAMGSYTGQSFGWFSPPKPREGFSGIFPSSQQSAPAKRERTSVWRGRSSLWQALPTFGFGASRRVGAVLAAVRNGRSKRASRVSNDAGF
jgi:calcium/calmodulin-dependent protein kinase I